MILEHLAPSVVQILPEISLILIGFFVEKHYVSRVSTFANSLALVVLISSFENPGALFTLYVECGLVIGVYGFVQYLRDESIDNLYYGISYYLYGSLTVGFLLFTTPFWAFLFATIGHIVMAIYRGGIEPWVHTGPWPYDIKWFIQNKSIQYPDFQIGKWVRAPLTDAFDPDIK